MPCDPTQLHHVLDECMAAKDHIFQAEGAVAELAHGDFQRSLRYEIGKIRGELEGLDRALRHAIAEGTPKR